MQVAPQDSASEWHEGVRLMNSTMIQLHAISNEIRTGSCSDRPGTQR